MLRFGEIHGAFRVECNFCLERPVAISTSLMDKQYPQNDLLGFISNDKKHFICAICIKWLKKQLDNQNILSLEDNGYV